MQWNSAATARCQERTGPHPSIDGVAFRPGVFLVCSRLRASIEAAAGAGSLPVVDER